jgi:hypothetical protein
MGSYSVDNRPRYDTSDSISYSVKPYEGSIGGQSNAVYRLQGESDAAFQQRAERQIRQATDAYAAGNGGRAHADWTRHVSNR